MKLLEQTAERNRSGTRLYLFLCPVCNAIKKTTLSNGKRDKTCGCVLTPRGTLTKENRKLHECWANMKTRCKNPNYKKAHRYSARGILLYPAWESFIVFQEWALSNGYRCELQIDRVDNNKGYTPENCRWVTNTENHRNSSSVKLSFEIAEQIRKEKEKGCTELELSHQFLISRRQINNIVKRRHWI